MVIKSLKTRIFSGLLACLFLMPVVSIHADPTGQVAPAAADVLERTVSAAGQEALGKISDAVSTACKATRNFLTSGILQDLCIGFCDLAGASADTIKIWAHFLGKHKTFALLGVPASAYGAYAVYYKLKYNKFPWK